MAFFVSVEEYLNNFVDKIRLDLENRRRQDRTLDRFNATLKPARGILSVDKLNLYVKDNAKEHRTISYELVHRQPETLVIRRGSTFSFAIRFLNGQSFDPSKDQLRLYFNYGPGPKVTNGTQAILKVTSNEEFLEDKDQWDVRIQHIGNDTITLQVQVPADIPVGIWRLQILSGLQQSSDDTAKQRLFDCPSDIYILFNAWCQDDAVHMEEPDGSKLLDEYVLSDVGKIWMGSYGSAQGRQWVYGQYDDASLPVSVYLLERSGLPHVSRSNPVLIARALTKMINSNDGDLGVLDGRWDGNYEEGTAPSAWTGSVKILEEYLLTRRPVRYGQCWVFAGVLTTVCRALGIPARPVSNLVSAHDANGTFTIDRYFDSHNNEVDDPFNPNGKDSIWNFHVWVEAWMSRPDLPKGYGGWQAIDATPQELSGGYFQCGPASVEAVRNGAIGLAYDVPFVLAEVNADLVNWREDKRSELGFSPMDINRYHIGRQILTKKANRFDHSGSQTDVEDVAANYKSIEGTKEERIALLNAVRSSHRAKRFFAYPDATREDVDFDLVELERVPIGEPFNVTIVIRNRSDQVRTISAVLSATAHYYNGVKAGEAKRATGFFLLQPKARESMTLQVSSKEYMPKLVEYGMMKLSAMASVQETNQTWSEEDDFQVLMPTLQLQVPDASKAKIRGQPFRVTISFVNSLGMALTGCKLHYEGPGLTRPEDRPCQDIPAGGKLSETLELTPKYEGSHQLIACFWSREFTHINGSVEILVAK